MYEINKISKSSRNVRKDMQNVKKDMEALGGLKSHTKETHGNITKRLLKRRKIKSPSTQTKIMVAPGFWIVPKAELLSSAEENMFISEMREKYGFDTIGNVIFKNTMNR